MPNTLQGRESERQQRTDWLLSACHKQVLNGLTRPMVLAILSLFILDLIDSCLISTFGSQSLTALGFTIPITNTLFGLSIGLSIGVVASIGRNPASHTEKLPGIVSVGILIAFLGGAVIALLGKSGSYTLFVWLGVSSEYIHGPFLPTEDLMPVVLAYMDWRWLGLPFTLTSMVCISVIRALGDTRLAAKLMIAWALLTMVLDIALVGGAFGKAYEGMLGVAVGHFIADTLMACVGIAVLIRRERLQLFVLSGMKKCVKDARFLLTTSLLASANNLLLPIIASLITVSLAQHGGNAVAAFGVILRIEPLLMLLPMTMTTAMPVFAGQNWAMGQRRRVAEALQYCGQTLTRFQLFIYLILVVGARALASSFTDDNYLQDSLTFYFLTVPVSYGALGGLMLTVSTLNAVGMSRAALGLNLFRLFLVYLPCVLLGLEFGGMEGLFAGMVLANFISGYLGSKYIAKVLAAGGTRRLGSGLAPAN